MKKTKKKVTKPTSTFLLVYDNQMQGSWDGYSDVKVLEVVRAWEFYYPEEPDPVVRDMDLDELP